MGISNVSSNLRPGICTSSTRPVSPYEGQAIYETDTNKSLIYDGSSWLEMAKFNSNQVLLAPNQPAFEVYKTNGVTSTANYVAFNDVLLNEGNHFQFSDTANARFTVPVDGKYVFYWSSIAGNAQDVYRMYIRINGLSYNNIHWRGDTGATGSEYAINSVMSLIVALNANDYVQIFFVSDLGNALYGGTGYYTHFSGHLIG